jgi:Uma2 family endonuclease
VSVAAIRFEGGVEIPFAARTWTWFRRWHFSADVPGRGRIDAIGGRIEVDTSPERAVSHGLPKVELIRALANHVQETKMGLLFADRMRISSRSAPLSAEPDLVLITRRSLKSGRVRRSKLSRTEPTDYLELQRGPDLAVEILSPSTTDKDAATLPAAYFAAGVRERWTLNALQQAVGLQVFHRGRLRFTKRRRDHQGFQSSLVLRRRVRLLSRVEPQGFPPYELVLRS